MNNTSFGNPPGFDLPMTATMVPLLWRGEGQISRMVTLDAASQDAGNSPVTLLRAGLVLAQHATSGKYLPYHPTANDGTQNPVGILEQGVDMLVQGEPADRVVRMLLGGSVRQRHVPNLDARARDLLSGPFLWDESPLAPHGAPPIFGRMKRVAGSYAAQTTDHGTTLVATGAATVTLPTAEAGLALRIVQPTDNSLTVVGLSNLVAPGTSGGSFLQFDTAGQRIGTQVMAECLVLDGGSLTWVVTNLGGTAFTAG